MSGCYDCDVDHCYDCEFKGGDPGWADEDGVYEVSCCCGRRTASGGGERLMAGPDPLGPNAACPKVGRCEACGGTRAREVATYLTPVGVFCATVCGRCLRVGNPPPVRSWGQACERVGAHCQHLGLDLDQMADLLEAEQRGQR